MSEVIEFPRTTIMVSEDDLATIRDASRRVALGDHAMSEHEYYAAAITNGRLDLLQDEDFRLVLIRMGTVWAHCVIAQIFRQWRLELELAPDHPDCPVGDQRIVTRSDD